MKKSSTQNNNEDATPDEIKAMLESMSAEQQQEKPRKTRRKRASSSGKVSKPKEEQKPAEEAPAPVQAAPTVSTQNEQQDNYSYQAVFKAEPVFEDDPKHTTDFSFMMGTDSIPVTQEDKDLYIKAVLNDVPLQLTIEVAKGIEITCRSLTPYERDLAVHAVAAYLKQKAGTYATGVFVNDYAREFMISMQLVSVGSATFPYRSYNSGDGRSREEHIMDLAEHGKVLVDNLSLPKYNLVVKALNVFENKLAVLNTAALRKDFWDPADAG